MPRSKKNSIPRTEKMPQRFSVRLRQKQSPVIPDEPTGQDLTDNLIDDCLARVFQFLYFADKLKIERVCKRWKEVSKLAWGNIKTLNMSVALDKQTDLDKLPRRSQTNEGVGKLLGKCGIHLDELEIGPPCDWKIMPIVSQFCPNLKILFIKFDCANWIPDAFFPHLQEVYFPYSVSKKRTFPKEALEDLPPESLNQLSLKAVCYPDRRGIRARGSLPSITATALKSFTELSEIFIDEFHLEPEVVEVISEKPSLSSLSISFCSLGGELSRSTLLTNLRFLDLAAVQEVDDDFLKKLSETYQNLENLFLNQCNVSDKGMMHLWRLSKLIKLQASWINDITDAPFGTLKSLVAVNCNGCKGVRADGIITLMTNAIDLGCLELEDTAVTERVLMAANEITKTRTDDYPLAISVSDYVKCRWNDNKDSPLLIVK